MVRLPILGLFEDANYAAEAGDALKRADISEDDYDFLTDAPYPEGAFGERHESHRLYVFPLLGALVGLTAGILLTSMTQLAYPLTQGGKPILSLPPMAVVTYETTMLGAIIFTVIGVVFESRLPRLFMGAYDTRITEGYIGISVTTKEEKVGAAEDALRTAGAEEIKRGWE